MNLIMKRELPHPKFCFGEFSVRGGEGKQTFVGDDSKQDLSLGSGDDIVFAGGGDDVLIASDGNNYFAGGGGNDEISLDPVRIFSSEDLVTILLTEVTDSIKQSMLVLLRFQ